MDESMSKEIASLSKVLMGGELPENSGRFLQFWFVHPKNGAQVDIVKMEDDSSWEDAEKWLEMKKVPKWSQYRLFTVVSGEITKISSIYEKSL